jgi:type I restriction enzyme S subunit
MDWVASELRRTVRPGDLRAEAVYHYSIPAFDETGDAAIESPDDIGSGKTLLGGGEVLISKLNPRKPRVLIARRHDLTTVCSGEFVALCPFRIHDRFLAYLLLAETTRQYLSGRVQSVTRSQQRVRPEDITKLWIELPPLAEQRTIAEYLDAETARIDSVIATKRRLAALILERQDAVIRLATRRGLWDAPLAASATPWIREIPRHWRITPLKRVGRLAAGVAFPDNEQGRVDEPLPYVKVADLTLPGNEEYIHRVTNTVTVATARRLGSTIFPANTIIFPKIGAALLSNRRRITLSESCTDQNLMGLSVEHGVMRYFFYLLHTLDFGRLRMPGPVPLLNERDAANLLVVVPPHEEQAEIADFLDSRMVGYRRLLAGLSQTVLRLEELRTALITAAVAGQPTESGAAA